MQNYLRLFLKQPCKGKNMPAQGKAQPQPWNE